MLGALYVLAGFGRIGGKFSSLTPDSPFGVSALPAPELGLHTSLWRCVVSESPRPAMAPNG